MGWWVQGIGVRGDVPDGTAVEPDEDDFALSWAPGTGWSWAILSEDWERDLGRLAVEVATSAATPVLTFLIADGAA